MSTAGMRQAGSRRSLGTSYVGFLRSLVVAVARSVGRRSDLTVTKNPEMFSAGAPQETCQSTPWAEGEDNAAADKGGGLL